MRSVPVPNASETTPGVNAAVPAANGGASMPDTAAAAVTQTDATTPETTPAKPAGREMTDEERAEVARKRRWIGALIVFVVRLIYRTVRVTCENLDGLVPDPTRGAILVTWHGRTLIPANLLQNRGYWALISLSRDGELQNIIFQKFGFQTVRGSTGRGGIKGALQMARKVKDGGVLTFTPDGPRGPTHQVQPGVILMAEKSGAPIVPVGISANRRWLMRSWDSYLIPQPFARAWFLVGNPIYVPPKLDDAGREQWAETVTVAINRLEREAERRAGHPNYPAEWHAG